MQHDILALDLATMTQAREHYVYALYAGRQLQPCYIGVGKGGRLDQHLRYIKANTFRGNMRKHRTLRACWLRGIPIVAKRIATDLTVDQAYCFERLLVSIYGRRDLHTGCLLNAAAGGFGPRRFAGNTRAALAEAGRRHMARPEIRKMLNERKSTPEARRKWALAAKGRVPTDEARAKMSASCRKRNERDQDNWRLFLASRKSGAFLGGKHSDAAKQKISLALRSQWRDPQIRAKSSEHFRTPNAAQKAAIDAARLGRKTMLGKTHSAETRMKMAAAQQARRLRERHIDIGA